MLPAKFGSIWPSSFRREDFFNISQSEKRIALCGQMEPYEEDLYCLAKWSQTWQEASM
jgi:hypothetical protein